LRDDARCQGPLSRLGSLPPVLPTYLSPSHRSTAPPPSSHLCSPLKPRSSIGTTVTVLHPLLSSLNLDPETVARANPSTPYRPPSRMNKLASRGFSRLKFLADLPLSGMAHDSSHRRPGPPVQASTTIRKNYGRFLQTSPPPISLHHAPSRRFERQPMVKHTDGAAPKSGCPTTLRMVRIWSRSARPRSCSSHAPLSTCSSRAPSSSAVKKTDGASPDPP
jgi:hypothetical protein